MNDGVKIFLAFSVGAAIGVVTCRSYFKSKYEKIADEEIESMRHHFEKRKSENKEIREEPVRSFEPTITLTSDIPVSDYDQAVKKVELATAPYIISPEEFFDEETDFEKITLEYYAKDRILADDNNVMLEDIESAIGTNWEDRFGEFTNGVVYIRNEARSCDYEILYVPDAFTFENEAEE